jgi:TPR repeat protein
VANCKEFAVGTTKSNRMALKMYTRAANAGQQDSMLRLGLAELNGDLGLRKNIKNAVKWLGRCAASIIII